MQKADGGQQLSDKRFLAPTIHRVARVDRRTPAEVQVPHRPIRVRVRIRIRGGLSITTNKQSFQSAKVRFKLPNSSEMKKIDVNELRSGTGTLLTRFT